MRTEQPIAGDGHAFDVWRQGVRGNAVTVVVVDDRQRVRSGHPSRTYARPARARGGAAVSRRDDERPPTSSRLPRRSHRTAERGPNGEPSVHEFQAYEPLRIVEQLAVEWTR